MSLEAKNREFKWAAGVFLEAVSGDFSRFLLRLLSIERFVAAEASPAVMKMLEREFFECWKIQSWRKLQLWHFAGDVLFWIWLASLRVHISLSENGFSQKFSFFLNSEFKSQPKTTDRICITITNMDIELYNSTAQAYIDGFLELTEDPEKYEFETLSSYANQWTRKKHLLKFKMFYLDTRFLLGKQVHFYRWDLV